MSQTLLEKTMATESRGRRVGYDEQMEGWRHEGYYSPVTGNWVQPIPGYDAHYKKGVLRDRLTVVRLRLEQIIDEYSGSKGSNKHARLELMYADPIWEKSAVAQEYRELMCELWADKTPVPDPMAGEKMKPFKKLFAFERRRPKKVEPEWEWEL